MKGIIVTQLVSDSALNYVHGIKREIRRLIIPQIDNICITFDGSMIYVFKFRSEAEWRERCSVVFETDVPETLVQEALTFFAAREKMRSLQAEFEWIIGGRT